MSPVPGSAISSLRWSVNAIVLGLSCSAASAVTDGTSTTANSCAPAVSATRSPRNSAIAPNTRIRISFHGMTVAPEIVRIDPARTTALALVAAPPARLAEQAAPRRLDARRVAPVGIARKRPVVALRPPGSERLPIAPPVVAAVRIGFLLGNEAILRILEVAEPIEAEVLDEAAAATLGQSVAGGKVDRQRGDLALRFGRRRGERCLRRMMRPGRLDDRLEDRERDFRAGLTIAEGAALSIGVVVAPPR